MTSPPSKPRIRSYLRHLSDSSKNFLKSSARSTSQRSGNSITEAGAAESHPEADAGAGSADNGNIDLFSSSPSSAQQVPAGLSRPALGSSALSTSGIVNTSVDHRIRASDPIGLASDGERRPWSQSWIGLDTALRALHQTTKMFQSLHSAIGILISCFEIIHVAAGHRRDYDEIASDLESLTILLERHLSELGSSSTSDCVSNIGRLIEIEAGYINQKKQQSIVKGIFGAMEDEEELILCCRRIEALLRRLQINLSLSAWSIINEHLANTRLESLTPAKLASYNSTLSTEIDRRTCTENTRTQVLSEVNGWSNDAVSPKVYWMNGMAGTGKTTIACTLAETLAKRKQLGASFFCTWTSPECRAAKRIVPTIAYQLARYSRPFQSALCRVLENDPDIGTRKISLQFECLLKEPLAEIHDAMPSNVVVVIDALNECDDGETVRALLDTLFRHAADLPLKFFVTSRPEPEIRDRMKSQAEAALSIMHLHEIERSLVQADIELYLREELACVHPSEAQIKRLAQLAGNLFIYAATAVRYIRPSTSKKAANPQERLQAVLAINSESTKLHSELDKLYLAILEAALNNDYLEPKEIERVRLVLWTAVCVREPVTVDTIAALAGLSTEDTQAVFQSLRSVLHISESSGLVSPLHASFPDFLFIQERSHQFSCDQISHSGLLARHCFTVMKDELRFNICNLESSFILDEEVEDLDERIERYISRPLSYACRYWADHLSATAPVDHLRAILEDFLLKRLLFWLEVLNLSKSRIHGTQGTSMLQKIQPWLLASGASSDLSTLVSDAELFVTAFGANPLSLSTPHIYISALPFAYKSSLLLEAYWKRMKGLLSVQGTAMEDPESAYLASWDTNNRIDCIALSPDGSLVAFCGGVDRLDGLTSESGHIGILNRYNGQFVAGLFKGHTGLVGSVAFSSTGTRIVSGSADMTICVWDAQDGNLIAGPFEGHTDWVDCVAFSPDGILIVSGSADKTICVWGVEDGSLVVGPFKGHTNGVSSVAFSPDGTYIVSGSADNTVCVWGAQGGDLVTGPLQGHTDDVNSVAYSPNGILIASGSTDKTIGIWDAHDGTRIATTTGGHLGPVNSVAFSPDGTRIVSGSWDMTICIWSVQDGSLVTGPFQGHTHSIQSVAFSPDGTRIFSGSWDRTICMWNTQDRNTIADLFKGHTYEVNSAAFSPDGTRIVSGSTDKTICVWNSQDGSRVAGPFRGHTQPVNSVVFSSDGSRVVSGSVDMTICVWGAEGGGLIAEPFKGHTDWISSVGISPDGTHIVSGSADKTIRLWNAHDGSPIATPLQGHSRSVRSVAYSPDGNYIISGSRDQTICLWNIHDGTLAADPLQGHTGMVNTVAFSPDGTRIASGSRDKTICVWNIQDGSLIAGPIEGHTDPVSSVAFSPDGTLIVSGSADKTVCVWDAGDGRLVAGPFRGHTGSVNSVAFSPDGRHVLSCSNDCSIRITCFQDVAVLPPILEGEWDITSPGWVINSAGTHLFWVPQRLHSALPRPYESFAIGQHGALRVDYSNVLLGNNWSGCYVGE